MQLDWDEHFLEIVVPAWQAYLLAEERLTEASHTKDALELKNASYEALREGGAATFYLHHFTEIILRAQPNWLPNELTSPRAAREWLDAQCTMLRRAEPVSDVLLLEDVADALKHAVLTRRLEEREVAHNEAVVVVGSGYGELRHGEGKYGGVDQVLVLARSGTRALSSIHQNVIDAWRRVAGLGVPAIGAR